MALTLPEVDQAVIQWPSWEREEYAAVLALGRAHPDQQPALYVMLTQTNLVDFYRIAPPRGLKRLNSLLIQLSSDIAEKPLGPALQAAHRVFVTSVAKRLTSYRRYAAMGVE